jgi:hypothetical protein
VLATNQQPPGVIPPKTPKDVEPALVETIGVHSGADSELDAAAAPPAVAAAFAAPVVAAVLAAPPPENCAAVAKFVTHPVDGNSKAPEGVAIVKVGTLRVSQPLEIENNAEKALTPPFASVDGAEAANGEEARVGETKRFAPAFGLMLWACATSSARATQRIVAEIGVRGIEALLFLNPDRSAKTARVALLCKTSPD